MYVSQKTRLPSVQEMLNPNRLYKYTGYKILTKHSAKKLHVITNPKTAQPHTILTMYKASLGKKITKIDLKQLNPYSILSCLKYILFLNQNFMKIFLAHRSVINQKEVDK